MPKTLRGNVLLRNPDTGQSELLKAGTTPPAWATKQITNPRAWEDKSRAAADDDDPVLPEDAPPLGGKGSGVDAWRDYATSKFDLEVADDADRDHIVSAVAAAHAAAGDSES